MKLILTLLAAFHVTAFAAAPPNFVFILADDQSWSGTSVRMKADEPLSATAVFRTPNLEKLAAQGMTFSQAYSAHCKCECSRAAIQMGRTTTTLNAPDKSARNWSAPVTDSLVNTLKKANPAYRAAHFGKWQWFHTPESMGYDASDGITMNEDGDTTDPEDPKQSFGITRRAKTFMESQVKAQKPFYLQLSYYAPHQKPQALAETLKKYEGLSGGGGKGIDTVIASADADFTLSTTSATDSTLSLTNGLSMTLSNVRAAKLTGLITTHVFVISGWTPSGTLTKAAGELVDLKR